MQKNADKCVKMCRFWKTKWKMVINQPRKGAKWWFSVLMGRGEGLCWAMAGGKMGGDGGKWGEMGGNGGE